MARGTKRKSYVNSNVAHEADDLITFSRGGCNCAKCRAKRADGGGVQIKVSGNKSKGRADRPRSRNDSIDGPMSHAGFAAGPRPRARGGRTYAEGGSDDYPRITDYESEGAYSKAVQDWGRRHPEEGHGHSDPIIKSPEEMADMIKEMRAEGLNVSDEGVLTTKPRSSEEAGEDIYRALANVPMSIDPTKHGDVEDRRLMHFRSPAKSDRVDDPAMAPDDQYGADPNKLTQLQRDAGMAELTSDKQNPFSSSWFKGGDQSPGSSSPESSSELDDIFSKAMRNSSPAAPSGALPTMPGGGGGDDLGPNPQSRGGTIHVVHHVVHHFRHHQGTEG